MIRILVAEDFDLLRQDICEMLSAEPDIEGGTLLIKKSRLCSERLSREYSRRIVS